MLRVERGTPLQNNIMPKYTPTEEDMESLYAEPAPKEEKPEAEAPETESEDMMEGEDEEQGAETLISKSALPKGCKEGDTIQCKVTKDYGDECGLQVVGKGGKPEVKEPSADEEIDALNEEE